MADKLTTKEKQFILACVKAQIEKSKENRKRLEGWEDLINELNPGVLTTPEMIKSAEKCYEKLERLLGAS